LTWYSKFGILYVRVWGYPNEREYIMTVLVEFVSERKVVKTLDNIEDTKALLVNLANVYNTWQLSDWAPSVLWNNVADAMEISVISKVRVDPFLRLSMRVKQDNKVVYKKVVWKNTVKYKFDIISYSN